MDHPREIVPEQAFRVQNENDRGAFYQESPIKTIYFDVILRWNSNAALGQVTHSAHTFKYVVKIKQKCNSTPANVPLDYRFMY